MKAAISAEYSGIGERGKLDLWHNIRYANLTPQVKSVGTEIEVNREPSGVVKIAFIVI